MTSRVWIFSGSRPSNGAKELAAQPGFLRLRPGNEGKVRPLDRVVNWGCSEVPLPCALIQSPLAVKTASDKLRAFKALEEHGVKTVQWTELRDTAAEWAVTGVVVVRNKLTGHSGDGIVIIEKGEEVPEAPLYTRYIFKEREYRVHVCNDRVIDTQQKIKDPDREPTTWKVRSHDNGFIFARNNVTPNAARDGLAIEAVQALGLDFGAVDIVEDKKGIFYVLEINTAPGLEGQTVTSYAEALRGYKSET